MDTLFISFQLTRSSKWYRIPPNFSDKANLKKSDKYVPLSNLSIYDTWKTIKSHTKIINQQHQLEHGMITLNYQIDHILHKIFKIISSTSSKNLKRRLEILQ